MAESWAPVPGHDNYEISREGAVRNLVTLQMLAPSKDRYPTVTLSYGAKQAKHRVHRLVALAFLPEGGGERPFVNHKDGNPNNCAAENLEWVSAAENNRHAVAIGLRAKDRRGRPVLRLDPTSGLTVEYPSIRAAAAATGVSPSSVKQALRKPGLRSGGFGWAPRGAPEAPEEAWRPVLRCDAHDLAYRAYSVSNMGRVRGPTLRAVNAHIDACGYHRVDLMTGPYRHTSFAVHRLVAAAWLAAPPSVRCEVDHKNGVRDDNRAENLQWLSKQEHSLKTFGKRVVRVAPDGTEVAYASVRQASQSAGVSVSTIDKALATGLPAHTGHMWRPAPLGDGGAAPPLTDDEVEAILRECLP